VNRSPIDGMLDRVKFKCTRCGKAMGTCKCWLQCVCGWNYPFDEKCGNPKCRRSQPQSEEQKADRKFGVEDGYKPGWTEDP
jgi:hypothetical protein